jgi:hypothetical protein
MKLFQNTFTYRTTKAALGFGKHLLFKSIDILQLLVNPCVSSTPEKQNSNLVLDSIKLERKNLFSNIIIVSSYMVGITILFALPGNASAAVICTKDSVSKTNPLVNSYIIGQVFNEFSKIPVQKMPLFLPPIQSFGESLPTIYGIGTLNGFNVLIPVLKPGVLKIEPLFGTLTSFSPYLKPTNGPFIRFMKMLTLGGGYIVAIQNELNRIDEWQNDRSWSKYGADVLDWIKINPYKTLGLTLVAGTVVVGTPYLIQTFRSQSAEIFRLKGQVGKLLASSYLIELQDCQYELEASQAFTHVLNAQLKRALLNNNLGEALAARFAN